MKKIAFITLGLHLPFFAIALCLPSCQSVKPIDEARLARIGDVALTLAERSGKISPEDAALAREAGKLVLSPAQAQAQAQAETATK